MSADTAGAVNVRDFGALGDGITDDTSAIQTAINTGRDTYLPAGIYRIRSSLTIAGSQVVYGDGMGATQIANSSAAPALVLTGAEYRTIRGLLITGGVGAGAHGISLEDAAYVDITRVRVNAAGGHGISMGHASHVNNVTISGCELFHSALDGIYMCGHIDAQVNAVWVNHNNITANGRNGVTLFGNGCHITENTIQSNVRHGVSVGLPDQDAVTRYTYGSSINSNYFERNGRPQTSDASVIGMYVGWKGVRPFSRMIQNLEIANNFFNESGDQYRSLIHVSDVVGTISGAVTRAVVVRLRHNWGRQRLLTWEGSVPLSEGFAIAEDCASIMPAAMVAELPWWVEVSGNHGRIGAPPTFEKVVTRSAGYTLNGITEASTLNRMINAAPVNVYLTATPSYPMRAGYAVSYAITGAGAVTFVAAPGAVVFGNAGPHNTGSLVRCVRLSDTEWHVSA